MLKMKMKEKKLTKKEVLKRRTRVHRALYEIHLAYLDGVVNSEFMKELWFLLDKYKLIISSKIK